MTGCLMTDTRHGWGSRGFARYLQTLDPATQVPPTNLLAFRRSRPAPYLYSPTEIQALLPATDTLTPTLRAATYRTLLGLLAVTGMRVGEALALDRDNVDLRERRLVVRHAKGGAGSWRCTLQPRGSSSPTRVFATSSVGRQRRRGPPPPGLDYYYYPQAAPELLALAAQIPRTSTAS